MLKKRKHKIKRRNTEPSVNHPLVLATPSAGPAPVTEGVVMGQPGGAVGKDPASGDSGHGQQGERPVNLAYICDSPTHATAV